MLTFIFSLGAELTFESHDLPSLSIHTHTHTHTHTHIYK